MCLQFVVYSLEIYFLLVGASSHVDHVTFIDSVKVYSKSKDAFGWSDEEAAQIGSQVVQQSPETRKTPSSPPQNADDQEGDDSSDLQEVESCNPQAATPLDRLVSFLAGICQTPADGCLHYIELAVTCISCMLTLCFCV